MTDHLRSRDSATETGGPSHEGGQLESLKKLFSWALEHGYSGLAIHRCQTELEQCRAQAAAPLPQPKPEPDDVLPLLGTDVQIHLGSLNQWVKHTVVGYYAWPSLEGDARLQRLYVRVCDANGVPNARMLCDVRRLDGTPYVVDKPAAAAVQSAARPPVEPAPDLTAKPVPVAGVPSGHTLVPTERLKAVHRDLDACQKVIFYAGGFDPAYSTDAQARLKEIDGWLAAASTQGQATIKDSLNVADKPKAAEPPVLPPL